MVGEGKGSSLVHLLAVLLCLVAFGFAIAAERRRSTVKSYSFAQTGRFVPDLLPFFLRFSYAFFVECAWGFRVYALGVRMSFFLKGLLLAFSGASLVMLVFLVPFG